MTREEARVNAEIMLAYAEGKEIECKEKNSNDTWDKTEPSFDFAEFTYRIKPEPKYRPWKPEEVPVGAVARLKESDSKLRSLIIQVDGSHTIRLGDGGQFSPFTFARDWEHSTDQGKTWLPCGVLEP